MAKRANAWTVEQLQEQYPHLHPASIYAAFAYYYDHQEELEQKIKEYDEYSEKMRRESLDDPLRKKLLEARGNSEH